MKDNTIVKQVIRMLIAGVLAIGILSVVNLFYGYSGIHIDNKECTTDYLWEPHQYKGNMIEGFTWLVFDENGYNNILNDDKDIDILLMGSSHMEAMNVAKDEGTGYILSTEMPEYKLYNIGVSGHTVYRCVDNMERAVTKYMPKKYLILESDSVALDYWKMNEVMTGTSEKIKSYDSGFVYHLQKIPAIKWMYKNIGTWMETSDATAVVATRVAVEEEYNQDYKDMVDVFLGKIETAAAVSGCQPIVFYHPEVIMNKDGSIGFKYEGARSIFADTCERHGIVFVDMTDDVLDMYSTRHILPYGFTNTEVGRGHLNKYGQRLIADRLISTIRQLEEVDE